jgi:hypothetical protein
MLLAVNNSLITLEFATGYVTNTWDQRMHILITITSCGTLLNQSLSKTAFAVTLLKLTKNWAHQGYQWILWFCIVSMNLFMIVKAKYAAAKAMMSIGDWIFAWKLSSGTTSKKVAMVSLDT